jgi:hypothetical protein
LGPGVRTHVSMSLNSGMHSNVARERRGGEEATEVEEEDDEGLEASVLPFACCCCSLSFCSWS